MTSNGIPRFDTMVGINGGTRTYFLMIVHDFYFNEAFKLSIPSDTRLVEILNILVGCIAFTKLGDLRRELRQLHFIDAGSSTKSIPEH